VEAQEALVVAVMVTQQVVAEALEDLAEMVLLQEHLVVVAVQEFLDKVLMVEAESLMDLVKRQVLAE
jgi:hypothetical protein